MADNPVGNSVGPQQVNLRPAGRAAPNQNNDGNRGGALSLWQIRDLGKQDALSKAGAKWKDRAQSGVNQDVIKLATLSSAVRHREETPVSYKGITEEFTPDEAEELLGQESERLKKTVKRNLTTDFGGGSKRTWILYNRYKGILSALKRYAHRSLTADDVNARIQAFTNLKLFALHGGDLHSTGENRKLKRTIARIPRIVLRNASAEVTYKDYSKADYQKYDKGRPLLSFHGFKATGNWVSRGPLSRVYREKLRAITASALILGGAEKALKAKELLREINKESYVARLGTKEDMVDRVLQRLATHGDVDTLIDDLGYELQSHRLMKGFQESVSFHNMGFPGGANSTEYRDFRKMLSRLRDTPHCVTILQNLNRMMDANLPGYTIADPSNVLRDMQFSLADDPVRHHLDRFGRTDANTAREALSIWAELIVAPEERRMREDIRKAALVLQKMKDKKNKDAKIKAAAYLNAGQKFADFYKNDLDPVGQSLLLLSCLKNPHASHSAHLASIRTMKSGQDIKLDNKNDVNGDIKIDNDKTVRNPNILRVSKRLPGSIKHVRYRSKSPMGLSSIRERSKSKESGSEKKVEEHREQKGPKAADNVLARPADPNLSQNVIGDDTGGVDEPKKDIP